MKKILCIGEALIDMICTDKSSPLSEGNHFLKKAGGAPTNVAAAIAALGGKVDLAAKVGIDPFGKYLIQTMQDFGVSTKWVLQDEQHFTTFAFVSLMENGERDFYFNRGADGQLSEQDIDRINLSEYDIIHFGSATGFLEGPLQKAYTSLLSKALEQKIFISFDPNYRQLLFKNNLLSFIHQSWHFLKQCNFFKVSDEEAMLLTNTQSIEDATQSLINKTNSCFAITLGKSGTLLRYKNDHSVIPSITISPVDTTGAGDAFVGAVLYQLSALHGKAKDLLTQTDWEKIIINANKAGARTCEFMGAMEAFKHLSKDILN
ncbi:MAG: carbohydrate kinase [Sphingobacteriia bacterium]|nr:carbohydrate kinase [Sphingobacteriia bacterium]